jgi:hypothetical protein
MAKATLVSVRQFYMAEEAYVDMVIWAVPAPVRGSSHDYKYGLALVVNDVCVMRYDNEAGKGDHKHVDNKEYPYRFVDIDRLSADFLVDARGWLVRNGHRPYSNI